MIIVYDKYNNNEICHVLYELQGGELEINALLGACEKANEKELGRFGTFTTTDEIVVNGYLENGIDTITLVWEKGNPTNAIYTAPVIHVPTFKELKDNKFADIGIAYEQHIRGSFVCSLGYPMQFNESDSLKMEGAIILMEVGEQATGYLTDANDETHYDVPLADIKAVKLEMLMAFAEAHAKKQLLRQAVKDATTEEELEAIIW